MRAAIGAVWPEVLPGGGGGGIGTGPHMIGTPLEDMEPPFAVVAYGEARVSEEWGGITNQAYLIDAVIYYVLQRDLTTDAEEAVAAKLEALEDALLTSGVTVGQVIDVTGQDVSEGNAINLLILDKQKPFFAGGLGVQFLVGEGP